MQNTDLLLLRRWRESRDAEAFSELTNRYANLVYAACRRVLGSEPEAEDVAQECFLVLAQQAPNRDYPLGPWLHTVATRRALNLLKSNSRRHSREQRYMENDAQRIDSSWDDVQQLVDEAIAALPEKLQQPLVLHFLEGRSHAEIGQRLRLPRTTVTTRIARGIEETRKHLKKSGISISTAAFTAMLATTAAEAAPEALTAALGKLALAGGRAALANSTVSMAGAAAGATGLALKFVLAVALVASIVGAVAYQFSNRAPAEITQSAESAAPKAATGEHPASLATVHASAPAALPGPETTGGQSTENASVLLATVMDGQGKPAPGVHAVFGEGMEGWEHALGDGNGDIRVMALPTGNYSLCAYKPGVGLAFPRNVAAGAGASMLTLEPMASISGNVTDRDSRSPIPNLEITLGTFGIDDSYLRYALSELDLLSDLRSFTDVHGNYRFDNLPPAKYQFHPPRSGADYVFPGQKEPPLVFALAKGEAREGLDLALEKGGVVEGFVLDTARRPIAGAKLWITSSRQMYFDMHAAKSDDSGAYRFRGLPPGATYTVHAQHEAYADTQTNDINLFEVRDVSDVNLQMGAGYTVQGTLVDDREAPVAEADVCFEDGRGTRTTTDTTGRFSFAHVAPGEHRVWIYKQSLDLPNPWKSFSMPESNLRDLVLVVNVLEKAGDAFIGGRVVDSAGNPLQGERVMLSNDTRTRSGRHYRFTAESDAGGHFRFDGLEEDVKWLVDVYPNRGVWARLYKVPTGTEDAELIVRNYAQVSGKVANESTGDPVQDFQIRHVRFISMPDGQEAEHESEWLPVHSAGGLFRLEEIAPPSARIEVRAPGFAPAQSGRLELFEGETRDQVVISLKAGRIIQGRVLAEENGQPIPGARVRAYAPVYFNSMLLKEAGNTDVMGYTTSVSAVTGGDGAFTLDPLTPGEDIGIVAWAEGFATQVLGSTTPEKAASLTIRMLPQGKLVVRIENAGELENKILVYCAQEGAKLDSNQYSNGPALEFSGLSAGSYSIHMRTQDDQHIGVLHAEVSAGMTTEVVADLAEFEDIFGSVSGSLIGPDSLERRLVSIDSAGDADVLHHSALCETDGSFTIGGLPPGVYILRGTGLDAREDGYTAEAEITITAGDTTNVTLELQPAEPNQ